MRSATKSPPQAAAELAQSPQSAHDEFDVIVVGAGLAGCTAAHLFAVEGRIRRAIINIE